MEGEEHAFVRKKCTYEHAMRISHREFTEEEKNPIGVRKIKSQRSENRVFLLIEERKSTGIGLMNLVIREEGSSQIRTDQEVFN